MTTREFEYIKENWDKCINNRWTYGLEPYRLRLFETIKPEGDYFVCFTDEDYSSSTDKSEFTYKLLNFDFSDITLVRIHHKKVQRITGYSKGPYLANWEIKDWKVIVREDKLKQLLSGR